MRKILLLLLAFVSSVQAGETRNKANNTNWYDRHYARHTFAITYPSISGTTVYVRAKDYVDGSLVANNASYGWIARSAGGVNSFNLAGITSTATTFTAICDTPSGYASYERNKTRVYENRDTGEVLGTLTDTWSFVYLPAIPHASEAVIYHDDTVPIYAEGNPCDGARTGLTFNLALTINPQLAGGWAEGNYVVTLLVDAATVYTANLPLHDLPPGGVLVNISATGIDTPHKNFTYSWKVNGETVAGGSIACADEIPLNTLSDSGSYTPSEDLGEDAPEMAESESTQTDATGNETTNNSSTTTTNPGSVSPPPTNFTNQDTRSNVANGAAFGDGITNQDIYNDVRQALMDAGNSGTYPTPQVNASYDFGLGLTDERGHLDDVEGKIQAVTDKLDDASDSMVDKVEAFGHKLDALPTSLSTVDSISLGTVNIGGQTSALSLNFSTGTFATPISIVRQVAYFILCVGFILACIQTTRGYL